MVSCFKIYNFFIGFIVFVFFYVMLGIKVGIISFLLFELLLNKLNEMNIYNGY